MATINATLSVSSADLSSSALALTKTMTMTTAGTITGLEFTSGLVRRKLTAVTEIDLVTVGAQMYGTPTATVANKLYIKNLSVDSTEFITVSLTTEELGRLYAGDWMFIPWSGDGTTNIEVQPSVASSMKIEYVLVHE